MMYLTTPPWSQALSKEISHVCELLAKGCEITLPVCLSVFRKETVIHLHRYNKTCEVCPTLREPVDGFWVCTLILLTQRVVLLVRLLGLCTSAVAMGVEGAAYGMPGLYGILHSHWQLIIVFQFYKSGWSLFLRLSHCCVSWSLVYLYFGEGKEVSISIR